MIVTSLADSVPATTVERRRNSEPSQVPTASLDDALLGGEYQFDLTQRRRAEIAGFTVERAAV